MASIPTTTGQPSQIMPGSFGIVENPGEEVLRIDHDLAGSECLLFGCAENDF
jgi:hypothetical protein